MSWNIVNLKGVRKINSLKTLIGCGNSRSFVVHIIWYDVPISTGPVEGLNNKKCKDLSENYNV